MRSISAHGLRPTAAIGQAGMVTNAIMSLIYVVGLIVTLFAGPETKEKELRA